MTQRFKLPPGGDVPRDVAARRIALSPAEFDKALPALLARGFPPPDPTTGNFDLDAIDRWRRSRHPHHRTRRAGACGVVGEACAEEMRMKALTIWQPWASLIMIDVWMPPVPMRGAQGFWQWSGSIAA